MGAKPDAKNTTMENKESFILRYVINLISLFGLVYLYNIPYVI